MRGRIQIPTVFVVWVTYCPIMDMTRTGTEAGQGVLRPSTGMRTMPWGLTRLEPFATVTVIPPHTLRLDARTQTGTCILEDGSTIGFGHRKSHRATDTPTSFNKGDGQSHKSYDPDSDQDSEED